MSVDPCATRVTSSPRSRSEAAVSAPMKLPPITIAVCASSAAVPTASASPSVRYVWTPTRSPPGRGSSRGRAPVATTSVPYAEPLASRELDLVLGGVDRVDPRVEAQLDDCLLPLLERLHERALALDLAAQVALRQGRAVVRRIRLGTDDGDVLLPACAAVLGGDAGGGEPASDDDDRVVGHLGVLPTARCSTHGQAVRRLGGARALLAARRQTDHQPEQLRTPGRHLSLPLSSAGTASDECGPHRTGRFSAFLLVWPS